jgi:hypothetical protein
MPPREEGLREITVLRGRPNPSELLPRVHRVISLLKRWLWACRKDHSIWNICITVSMNSLSASTVADRKAEGGFSFALWSKQWPWSQALTTLL